MSDLEWMAEALEQAHLALARGEVPIGAVVVRDGKRLGRAHNLRESRQDPLGHAETLALRRAARRVNDWRLTGADLYVTVEPCPMCAGALLQARIRRVVFGVPNLRVGSAGTRLNLVDYPGMDHHVQVQSGVRAEESYELLQRFFQGCRGAAEIGSVDEYGQVAEPG